MQKGKLIFLTYPFLRSGERSKKMPVFRVSKNRDFTVIANSVFKDRRLSAKAKGILVEMLSLPENWDYTLKGLTTLFSDGIDSIRQGIKELEENGYIMCLSRCLQQNSVKHGDLRMESQSVKNSCILPTDSVKPCSHRKMLTKYCIT